MANKAPSWISILAVGLFAAAYRAPALGQTAEPMAGGPVVQRRCTTVALTSDTPLLPSRLIQPYLQQRDDFRESGLALTDDPKVADVSVALTRNGVSNTRIEVVSRTTGRHDSATSDWADYPGMVALSIMNQLRSVCPGSIVAQLKARPAPKECVPLPALRSLGSISACSRTSWMDNRELYDALRANGELKESSIGLLPACSSADATLEITHNLEQTLEWNWRLVSGQSKTISSGRVMAFAGRDAAEKVGDQLAYEIAFARGHNLQIASSSARPEDEVSIRNVRSHLLSSDFSLHDSRISLSLDHERVLGTNATGKVVFIIPREDLLDARLRKEWNHPLQLDEPIGLVGHLESLTSDEEVMAAAEALAVYVTVGAVLAQVRTPVHILDLAWQENGAVKTVSVQVPVHESKRLLHALRPAASREPEQTCSSEASLTSGAEVGR